MHNGGVAHFPRVKRNLLNSLTQKSFELIHGTTDSEVIGAIFVDKLKEVIEASEKAYDQRPKSSVFLADLKGAMLLALKHVITHVTDVMGEEALPSSLNCCMTTGDIVVACRFRNCENEPPSLYYRLDEEKRTLVVSSEPLTFSLAEALA
jgi:glutamine amidotransferase